MKAKSDARSLAVEPILDLPNVTLLTGRKVLRIETDASGKTVTEVVCATEHGEERWSGDIVALAAGAANSAAILLNSASSSHPNGLANGSDQVGRIYMFHTLTAMVSLTAAPVDVTFPKTQAVNDFYFNDPRGGFDTPMGHIQLLEYMSGQTLEGEVSDWLPPALVPDVFAGALAQIGLPPRAAPQALLLFNLGVEIGQLTFIGAVLALWALIRRSPARELLRGPIVAHLIPAYAIGGLAAYWLIERVLVATAA
ncbi:6'''-hydroxyparomomycin C oxidase [mine drainage metagenome]|uniref:6'''-hydroxyparomomycin C oxidase n=1 Tax=mine drainage metagenome TaxID=410659 RepID=A0A1J5PJG0_9ZZZZ